MEIKKQIRLQNGNSFILKTHKRKKILKNLHKKQE